MQETAVARSELRPQLSQWARSCCLLAGEGLFSRDLCAQMVSSSHARQRRSAAGCGRGTSVARRMCGYLMRSLIAGWQSRPAGGRRTGSLMSTHPNSVRSNLEQVPSAGRQGKRPQPIVSLESPPNGFADSKCKPMTIMNVALWSLTI